MHTKLNHESVFCLLSSGDVASNKLYYHSNLMTLSNISTVNSPSPNPIKVSMHDTECKQIAMIWKTPKCLIQEICILWWSLKQCIWTCWILTKVTIIIILLLLLTYVLVKNAPSLNKITASKCVSIVFFWHCCNCVEHVFRNLLW